MSLTPSMRGFVGLISTPNDDLNTVFYDVVSLRGSCPRSSLEELRLDSIVSLRVKSLSLQEKNMLFVDHPLK